MTYEFDWQRILLNDFPVHFLLEVALRSAVMFITLLIVLKLAGKRGVKQLSIFETVIIISLGSAAGDPMFYHDVGILPAIGVFVMVLLLYRLVTWLTGKSPGFERMMEGETECLIVDGKFAPFKFERESLSRDEFFTELRLRNIEHLGQVRRAYLETTGDVSVYFFEDKDVKAGLPILPEYFNQKVKQVKTEDLYACAQCGTTQTLSEGKHACSVCKGKEWVTALSTTRLS
jgi:uncharacterized membrane protein YcaP (DUF421 family)